MTEELMNKLKEAHAEELADIEKYNKLIHMAKEAHHDELAGVLEDIKHDEETHAAGLEYLLTM